MRRCEGRMAGRVPVLREDDERARIGEFPDASVHSIDDLVAIGHGQRAPWHKVDLHVDHQQRRPRGNDEGAHGNSTWLTTREFKKVIRHRENE